MSNNYTLGRGKIYFGKFISNTQSPEGERYIGNTPEFTLTMEAQYLDHFSSDAGIKEKDESIPLEVTRKGTLVTDHIHPDNIALFFFGTASTLVQSAITVTAEVVGPVIKGLEYQLGTSPALPAGHKGLTQHTGPSSNVIVKDSTGVTTYVEGTDYTIDMTLGRLTVLASGAIASAANLKVDYKVAAKSRQQVISGNTAIEGSLRFIAQNPKGDQFDYFMPWAKVTPNGDYALKGEEWQRIPFNVEVLKRFSYEAIYLDGRPFTP